MPIPCTDMLTSLFRAILVVMVASGATAHAQISTGESPAAKQFAAWLDAFNKGDRAGLVAYHQQSFPYAVAGPGLTDIDGEAGLRAVTGGFEIMKPEPTSPTRYSAVLKERQSRQFAHATMEVAGTAPHRVVSFEMHPIDTPDEFLTAEERRSGGGAIDGKRRRSLIDKIVHDLDEDYVFPDVARRMIAALREHAAHGAYDKVTGGRVFADALTKDLQEVSHDQHVRVEHRPPGGPGPGPQSPKPDFRAMNYGFGAVERLKGNVALVVIHGFWEVDGVREGIAGLMSKVADASALIIDLRDNGGGDAHTVDLVASYLFGDNPVHLRDVVVRDGVAGSSWTDPNVKGKRFGGTKPIYVLINAETGSGAESLAYDLQSLHRATLIGEKTVGAANMGRPYKLDDWFVLMLPVARPINPVTKTNWEGVGVRPDVAASASAALDEALRRAEQDLRSSDAAVRHTR
jgi:retinol-binding protein 3